MGINAQLAAHDQYKRSKLIQTDLGYSFVIRIRSVHARLQVFMCSGYDLGHHG